MCFWVIDAYQQNNNLVSATPSFGRIKTGEKQLLEAAVVKLGAESRAAKKQSFCGSNFRAIFHAIFKQAPCIFMALVVIYLCIDFYGYPFT